MREYLVQTLLHACVAAAVVEVLLRVWRLAEPGERLAYRLLVLALPALWPPVLWLVAPFRQSATFADTQAIFAASHWGALRLADLPFDLVAVLLAAPVGVALYVRDVLPLLRSGRATAATSSVSVTGELRDTLDDLSARLRLKRSPAVRCLETAGPVLFTSGVWRPALIVSTGALTRLDADQRRAALAHELAHVARDDLLLGWGVMLVRTALVLNPVVQVAARAAVQEMERRADDLAAQATGMPAALASGMAALGRPAGRNDARRRTRALGPFNEFLADLTTRGRAAALAGRRRRLGDRWPPERVPLKRVRLVLTTATLAGLLFFVV